MKSTEYGAVEAAAMVKGMVTLDEVAAFTDGDDRKTVLAAVEEKMEDMVAEGHKPPVPGLLLVEEKEKLYTIFLPEIDNHPKHETVRVFGTKNEKHVSFEGMIKRGVNVPNVPEIALRYLDNMKERRFTVVKKSDGSANEMVPRQVWVGQYSTIEGPYTEPKPEPK